MVYSGDHLSLTHSRVQSQPKTFFSVYVTSFFASMKTNMCYTVSYTFCGPVILNLSFIGYRKRQKFGGTLFGKLPFKKGKFG